MAVKSGFLDKAYDLGGTEAMKDLYAGWSDSYDEEIAEHGYVTPQRCARALAAGVEDKGAPLLDIGCGTGLSGAAFASAGFTTIDGTDFTPEMLEKAAAKGIYRTLKRTDADNPFPFEAGSHANAAAVGVFSPSHAPAETIDAVMAYLPRGGRFVFSLNDHALADASYEGRIMDLCDSGAAAVEFKEYGEHLPKNDLKSTVYVLRKM